MKRIALCLLALSATPALAQQPDAHAGHAGHAAPAADAAVTAVRGTYDQAKDYLIRAAEQMPEEEYGFAPTAEVRSFGRMVGHVANGNYMICALALGEQSPNTENVEQARTTKAALVEALKASFAYCDRAYAQSDADALQPIRLFGRDATRMSALVLNAAHGFEHYGNMVTYLRIKGMVPPSSQPRS